MRVVGLNGIGSVPTRFCVINPPMFSAIPATTSSAPSVHRNAPCTKLVGTNHSSARDARIGRTNRSGGAMGTPGRSSLGGSSEGIGLIETKFNREMFGRDANLKSEGRLRFRKRFQFQFCSQRSRRSFTSFILVLCQRLKLLA